MSLVEIEAELSRLNAADLRRLALSSWAAFLAREGADPKSNECSEEDPQLLAALDEAVRRADGPAGGSATGAAVRTRIREWTTK